MVASAAAGRCSVPIAPAFGFVGSERPAFAPEASPAKRASIESPSPRGRVPLQRSEGAALYPPCDRADRACPKNSFFTINFLDTAVSAPYIGSVNARSAPAAASRRPRKKRTKKQAGTVPLSGPPPPIGHPIRHPMRRPARRPVRHPLRRQGLTAGPRPVRPSASAGPCCPAMPPGDAAPGVERAPARPGGWKISYRDCFCALPNRNFPAFLRSWGDFEGLRGAKKRL